MMRPEKVQKLKQAYELANNIMSSSGSPEEALKKAGVTRKDIESAKGYLNNPISNIILGKLGSDKNSFSEDLNKLENIFGYSHAEQAPAGELEELQKTLQSLK